MTFATEKDKVNSARFMLVRITGRIKYVGTSYDTNTYRQVVFKKPVKVTRFRLSSGGDGGVFTELAEVATLGAMTTGKWFYDSSDGYLYFNTPTGYSYYALVDFEEFLTGGIERYYPRIPTGAGDNETWKPLVSAYPTFTQSIEDVSAGVFSISGSSFDVINEDNWADKYLVGTATFYERDCDVWIGINDQLKKVFTGTISQVSVDKKTISFSVLDKFNLMNKTATFGLPAERLTINANCAPGFSTVVDPADEGMPIPRHFQGRLPHNYYDGNENVVNTEYFYKAKCVSYSTTISGTTNRKWLCGSVKWRSATVTGAIAMQTYTGNVTAINDIGGSCYVKFSAASNLTPGATVKWTTGGTPYYGRIQTVNVTYLSVVYDMLVIYFSSSPAVGSTFASHPAFIAQFGSGDGYPSETNTLIYEFHYTISTDTTTGNIHLTLVDNFETTAPFGRTFDYTYVHPSHDVLTYDFYCEETNLKPGATLKALVEASGLTANAASFTTFDSGFSGYVRFSIPLWGDSEIGTYADYAAKILESAGAYLRLNESDEVELKTYTAPAPSETLTAANYSDLTVDVNFQDIYTTIESKNIHFTGNRTKSVYYADDIIETTQRTDTNEEALSIFGSRRVKYLQHVLTTLTSSITNLLALNTYRRLKLRFRTATENIDTSLGDDYYIQSDNINDGTALAVKVVSKTVSVDSTTVEAIDLHGVV